MTYTPSTEFPGDAFQDITSRLRTTKGSEYALNVMAEAADIIDSLRGRPEQAWREGYFTGKRDYAGSITIGMCISTPNPYIDEALQKKRVVLFDATRGQAVLNGRVVSE